MRNLPHLNQSLSPEGRALLEEVEQLADEVLAAEKEPPATMTQAHARNIRKAANALFSAMVALSLLLSITALLNRFSANGVMGMRFFVEPTNAMLRQVPRGSLLITVTRASNRIEPGDIVTYYALPGEPDTRLTRIVDERLDDSDKPLFRTKRAADATPDSMLINMSHILGVKRAVIPYAGRVVSFVQTYAWGFAVLAGALTVSAAVLRLWAGREHPELKTLRSIKKKKAKKGRKGRGQHADV